MAEIEVVWHYTSMDFFGEIDKCGELRPANRLGIYAQPLLWFSANQQWEYMTTRLGDLRFDISFKKNTPFQQLAREHRAIRYGLPASDPRLLNWKETCRAGGLNREERRYRAKVAKNNKSDANEWFTTIRSVPLTDLRLQLWSIDGWSDF